MNERKTKFSGCSVRGRDFLQNFQGVHETAILFKIFKMLRTGTRFYSKLTQLWTPIAGWHCFAFFTSFVNHRSSQEYQARRHHHLYLIRARHTTSTNRTPIVARFSKSSPKMSGTATGTPKASTDLDEFWFPNWRLSGHNLRSGNTTQTTAAAAEPRLSPQIHWRWRVGLIVHIIYIYIHMRFRKLSAMHPWIWHLNCYELCRFIGPAHGVSNWLLRNHVNI